MAYTIPCIKGKLGSTDYYLGTMKAEELVGMAKPASRLEEWEDFTIEERMQRELNDKRVREEIAPYIANDPDRFFRLVSCSSLQAQSLRVRGVR